MASLSGHIQVIYGPMFSGKSSEMLRKVRRYRHAKKQCLIINYINDNRYFQDCCMATHDKQTQKAVKTSNLHDLSQMAKKYDVIAVDQGQFFPQIVQFCEDLANMGKIVIVAALDGTFQRKSFGNIINLLPVAEKVIKLSAVCVYCAKQAAFTQRTIDSQQVQLIGGQESYKPVCRKCFFTGQKSKKQNSQTKQQAIKSINPELKEQNVSKLNLDVKN